MSDDICLGPICFTQLSGNEHSFFGFQEFLTGLALMVIAWTLADFRYQFRLRTAMWPMQRVSFFAMVVVGFLSLLTDLWCAKKWYVLKTNLMSIAVWQTILGAVILLIFLGWSKVAFFRPSIFGKYNAERYARELYKAIIKGSMKELGVVADEFLPAVKGIICYAPEARKKLTDSEEGVVESEYSPVSLSANSILHMIADRRFCRAIIEYSPMTAFEIFSEVRRSKKYKIGLSVFSGNLLSEALRNRDSFLFHETEWYLSGLIGHEKPLSNAMYSCYEMAESVGALLDPDVDLMSQWDSSQLGAYCRVVLLVYSDYIKSGCRRHSPVLYRASEYISGSVQDIYKLNNSDIVDYRNDIIRRLNVVVNFYIDLIRILDDFDDRKFVVLKIKGGFAFIDMYDQVAGAIFNILCYVSTVKKTAELCWYVQHNCFWGSLIDNNSTKGGALRIIKYKIRRKIYDEVKKLEDYNNFLAARILALCLNMTGLRIVKVKPYSEMNPLYKVLIKWTKKNYLRLYSRNKEIAEACLVDGMTYDENKNVLIKKQLRSFANTPQFESLFLD